MIKLTRVKALEVCRDLWDDLARTGRKYKMDWPGFETYDEMLYWCPCCEFTKKKHGRTKVFVPQCSLCPLLEYWMKSLYYSKSNNTGCPCENIGSPYRSWAEAKSVKDRKKYAGIIAGFPRTELEKIKEAVPNED